ncbi:MAG: hypothetical protein OGM65_10670 [Faecalibacterium prausnitzii]|jgi:hypothetical protein|nr:MAG: hypothetical protein OGM65_10670 [Faecalibacterium prausnitzii]
MMWAKKIAAGVLAAALSLTLLTGCSGGGRSGSVISEGETISFDTSASYRLVQYTGNIYLTYELECTNEKDGTKIYAGQANKARCFAGTHEAITMDVRAVSDGSGTDADGNVIQPGLYTVNYKDNTYKEGGTFDSVEKVLAATAFCNYEKENGTLKEVRAATGTKNKQEYYVELLKFDFGTAAVFYTKEPWKTNTPNETDPAALKYIEVYLPGETAARASFEVKVTPIQGSFVETAHSAVTELHKVTE